MEGAETGGRSATGFCAVWQEQAANKAKSSPPIRTLRLPTRIFFYKMRIILDKQLANSIKKSYSPTGLGSTKKNLYGSYFGHLAIITLAALPQR